MIPDTTHTDLQAADASDPHFNALVLEAGVSVYPRPAWWLRETLVVIAIPEEFPWGDFPDQDFPQLYAPLLHVSPVSLRRDGFVARPYHYALHFDGMVEFEPTPRGGETVVPL